LRGTTKPPPAFVISNRVPVHHIGRGLFADHIGLFIAHGVSKSAKIVSKFTISAFFGEKNLEIEMFFLSLQKA
jgi:hypothetical protein